MSSLISILFGHLIARKGLKRMREFENKIEQITASSLHERIDLNEWPKELKRFGKKFNTMLDRLQSSFDRISQFSSDIAHELRTPINNLRGITEVALLKDKLPSQYRVTLEKHMNEYQQLTRLIENLLFLARSDHGQLIVKKEVVNAYHEISNICDYYRALAEDNNIELSCSGNADLIVDAILFKRAINNLLSNALNYTQANGKVKIAIKSMDKGVSIAISDTGQGIADRHVTRVFDRFFRVDSSRSLNYGGIGLGLPIVKSIIDLHNGKVNIESQLNVGTTVSLWLPSFTE